MVKVELIDIDCSSDEEPASSCADTKHSNIEKSEQDNGDGQSCQPSTAELSNLGTSENQDSGFAPSQNLTTTNADENGENEDEKRRKYIDKLLNMHAHVCNRIASLEHHMDSIQRLKWQRQASLSVPAVNGKFPTNHDVRVPPPVSGRSRAPSRPDPDADYNPDARPPWMVASTSGAGRATYRNNAAATRRRKTYKRKKGSTTKQTARKSTTVLAIRQPARKKQTTRAKPKKPSTPKTTPSKPSTSTKVSTSSVKKAKSSSSTASSVKKEVVKKEYVKREK